jgi:hypothetical protein
MGGAQFSAGMASVHGSQSFCSRKCKKIWRYWENPAALIGPVMKIVALNRRFYPVTAANTCVFIGYRGYVSI